METDTNPAASALIESAFMSVRKTPKRTVLADLTSVYYFRFRAFTHDDWQDDSPVVSLLVVH